MDSAASSSAQSAETKTEEKAADFDGVRVEAGFEKAFGAALSDDLKAPLSHDKDETGWVHLSDYSSINSELPNGVKSLSDVVL